MWGNGHLESIDFVVAAASERFGFRYNVEKLIDLQLSWIHEL